MLTVGHMGRGSESVNPIKGKFSIAPYDDKMGCEIITIKGTELPDLSELRDHGQLQRGEFLDAFGRLESAVMKYIGKVDVKATPSMPFSQKLTALAKSRGSFQNPKRLDIRIAAIRELLPVRADIVHSALEIIVTFDGRTTTTELQFQNSSDAGRPSLKLTSDQLAVITRRLNQLATQFHQQRLREAAPAAPASASA